MQYKKVYLHAPDREDPTRWNTRDKPFKRTTAGVPKQARKDPTRRYTRNKPFKRTVHDGSQCRTIVNSPKK